MTDSSAFNTAQYSEAIADLLKEAHLAPLDAGQPNRDVLSRLQSLDMAQALGGPIKDRNMAEACKSGLWLLHNFLDESHTISQSIETPSGSFWHGIMHRREPDYPNAKYWFRQVGEHPIYPRLLREAQRLLTEHPSESAGFLRSDQDWDPVTFINLCQNTLSGKTDCEHLCRLIQQREWELLFDFCHSQALGK